MKGSVILLVGFAFVAVLLLLTFYPSIEGNVRYTGDATAAQLGYVQDTSGADQAKGQIWAVLGGLLILAGVVEIATAW